MSIDEDDGGAGRGDNHKDYEDNADDKDDYNDTGCDLFKCFNGNDDNDNTTTSASSILFVYDDDDGDIDKTHNNDNNNLSGGGTLPLPPYRPTQGSEHHGSPDHKKDGAWEQNNIIANVNYIHDD